MLWYTTRRSTFLVLPFLLAVACGCKAQAPSLELTSVPSFGSTEDLRGLVTAGAPEDYQVAVYIYVGTWWTKPRMTEAAVPVHDDGTWVCDITTGGIDEYATEIAAFLVPRDAEIPTASGDGQLPAALSDLAVASARTTRPPFRRTLEFSGYEWGVKIGASPRGPGPNLFSDSEENAWVDDEGRLHLRITYRDDKWHCAEVVCRESLGYGTYAFEVSGDLAGLDPRTVVGLFTWDDAPDFHHREIDVEIGRWGKPEDQNAQFVVQPYDRPDGANLRRFDVGAAHRLTTHSFLWHPDRATFRSESVAGVGEGGDPELLASWAYDGPDMPEPKEETPRINFWLLHGAPPANESEAEIVVSRFEFTPLEAAAE